jgi:hypothetical protein
MELKGQKLEVERSPDGTAVLKEGSSTLLTVQKSRSRGEMAFEFGNGETVEIGYADRPMIQVIGGQAVVRQQVKSLVLRCFEWVIQPVREALASSGDRKFSTQPINC